MRLLGKRRARRLRRRLGFVALGAGVGLLKPTITRTAVTVLVAAAVLLVLVTQAG